MSSSSQAPPRPSRTSSSNTASIKPSLQIHSPPTTPPKPTSPRTTDSLYSPAISPRSIPERTSSMASMASTASSSSSGSNPNRHSIGRINTDPASKRRGFSRPQGTEFANSAKSRESVMALGSIQHLQYFFAKTGLLDGKGGGLKRRKNQGGVESPNGMLSVDPALMDSTYSSLRSSPDILGSFDAENDFLSESPDEMECDEAFMLPPTTSTYKHQEKSLPPRPDTDALRGQLRTALAITKRAWQQSIQDEVMPVSGDAESLPQGVHEIHCTELTDLATSAVRAAKGYYYTTDISLLSSKDEKALREEFLFILDVLKRMVGRKFEGGVLQEERNHVVKWIESVEACLDEEEREITEMKKVGREWLEGDWKGKYMVRNHLFMSYFNSPPDSIPAPDEITPETELPTQFLESLRNGLYLIQIHNSVVRRSKRPFGQIKPYHIDFGKPYRMADNLRYWKKAVEIRWEVKLSFDVMAVVNGTNNEAWRDFNNAIALWCDTVLKEVRADWEMGEGAAAIGEGAEEAAIRKRSRTLTLKNAQRPQPVEPPPTLPDHEELSWTADSLETFTVKLQLFNVLDLNTDLPS